MTTSARPMDCVKVLALLAAGALLAGAAKAQSPAGDSIGELLRTSEARLETSTAEAPQRDPREGDPSYEQARALMSAIDGILNDVAEQRAEAKKLPAKDDFLVTPLWTETREDREARIRTLLDATLGIVTDAPVVEVQKRIEQHR